MRYAYKAYINQKLDNVMKIFLGLHDDSLHVHCWLVLSESSQILLATYPLFRQSRSHKIDLL